MEEPSNTERTINLLLKEMEEGFQVDVHTLMNLKRDYEKVLSCLKREMQEKLGRAIRANSNKDLADLLFNDFYLPSLRTTPTGKPCVSVDVLEKLRDSDSNVYSFLKSVIEFKSIQSLIKSVKTISNKLDLHGRIHPEFNHLTCPTGRIYSYIQNLLKEVRRVLIPDQEGNVFIELDWCQ